MRALVPALILFAAVVNLVPGLGVLSTTRMETLYGVSIAGPDLAILMRHRAVLLALIGVVLAASAFQPALRPLAYTVGFVSMLSIVAIAWGVGDANAQVRRVATIDIVASVALAAAALLDRFGAAGSAR